MTQSVRIPILSLAIVMGIAFLPGAEAFPRFTPPPGQETPKIKTLIDSAQAALTSGKSAQALLTDVNFMSAHAWARFRRLVQEHPASSPLTIVTSGEPGDRLVVQGVVLDSQGQPVAGAVVYVYHTSARGWYSDKAAHVAANEGDRKHARLFGYVTTSADGTFELHTIRPAGYPDSNLPAHIHVEVQRGRANALVSEIQFDDDPRLTPEMRKRSLGEGFVICPVQRGADNAWHLQAKLHIR